MAGDALLEERGLRADADQLADGRPDHRAGRRRRAGPAGRSARRAAADRDRRALLPQGAALHHRRRRPRHRPAGLGERGPRQADRARLLRAARPRARATARARLQRSGRVDHPRGQGALPGRRRSASTPTTSSRSPPQALDEVRREVWQQARRAGDTSGARWLKGARWALWKRPERLSERQQAKLATIEHVNRRLYRAYLLKEQLRLVFHSEPRRGRRAARGLAGLGAPLPDRELRQARQDDHAEQGRDRRDAHPPALERPHRSDQHHPAPDLPPRLRLPLRRGADRARHAHRRRPPAATPRPRMTNPRKRQELPISGCSTIRPDPGLKQALTGLEQRLSLRGA